MDLTGSVALVTGASRGIGRAIAVALAEAGADVACAARATRAQPQRTAGTLDDSIEQIAARGRQGLALRTNLASTAEVERMIAATLAHFGRLDVLVNNAAITFPGDLDLPLRRHDLIMEVNLRAPLVAIRSLAPHLKARGTGAILNISSAAAQHVVPGLMAYGISKAGLERLTTDVAVQLAPHHIAVNCLRIDLPVASEGFVANMPAADHSTWQAPAAAARTALWILRQPPSYTGQVVNMSDMLKAE
jgi:NAD(P)-dependent dehydrogenase (short-subunit alcohol dehydrogenase family)